MRTGKKKMDKVLRNVEKIFKDQLIQEVCQIYVQLIIDDELNEQSLNDLLIEYTELFEGNEYDGQYTWVALAYTQFELGMLDEGVKINALNIINEEIKKMKQSKITKLSIQELIEFKELLNSKMPDKIKVRKPKYYKCPWKIGDVFALKLDNEIYKDYNLQGKYVMIVKVDEHVWYPKHICPKILCYNWYGDEPLCDIDTINKLGYLPTFLFNNYFNYKIFVTIDKEQELNNSNLLYIGNIGLLNLPQIIEEDVKNESKKNIMSVERLKNSMLPINLYIKRKYKIKSNNHQIVEISDNY